jgi:hypothetical protein
MAGYTWAREMGDKIKECNFCVMPGLIECNDKRYCPDCYSLKIWKKKIENVGKYLDKKEREMKKSSALAYVGHNAKDREKMN